MVLDHEKADDAAEVVLVAVDVLVHVHRRLQRQFGLLLSLAAIILFEVLARAQAAVDMQAPVDGRKVDDVGGAGLLVERGGVLIEKLDRLPERRIRVLQRVLVVAQRRRQRCFALFRFATGVGEAFAGQAAVVAGAAAAVGRRALRGAFQRRVVAGRGGVQN